MKTEKCAGIALFAAALLTAGVVAFASGPAKSTDLLEKIRIGVTTSQQVTEILGPPEKVEKFARREVEAWDYRMQDWGKYVDISIEIDSKGIVSNVQKIIRYGP